MSSLLLYYNIYFNSIDVMYVKMLSSNSDFNV